MTPDSNKRISRALRQVIVREHPPVELYNLMLRWKNLVANLADEPAFFAFLTNTLGWSSDDANLMVSQLERTSEGLDNILLAGQSTE